MTEVDRDRVVEEIVRQITLHLGRLEAREEQAAKYRQVVLYPERHGGINLGVEREKTAASIAALRALAKDLGLKEQVDSKIDIPPDMV
jgi:hypothetical protein